MLRALTTPANRPVSGATATARLYGEVSAESSAARSVSDSWTKVEPSGKTWPGRSRSAQPTGRASPSTTRVGSASLAASTSRTTLTRSSSSSLAGRKDSDR